MLRLDAPGFQEGRDSAQLKLASRRVMFYELMHLPYILGMHLSAWRGERRQERVASLEAAARQTTQTSAPYHVDINGSDFWKSVF